MGKDNKGCMYAYAGPLSSLLAPTRSVWSEDKQRANTDSPGVGKEKVVSEGV